MMQVAGVVFDHFDDGGRLMSLKELPVGLIKTAAEYDVANPTDYALGIITRKGLLQKYPISDPVNTYLSAKYFVKTAENLPVDSVGAVAAKIANALYVFDLIGTDPEFRVIEELAKTAGEEIPFGPVLVEESAGPTVKELTHSLEKQAELAKLAKKLTYQERKALPDSVFALVIKTPDGRKIRKYPLHDEAHVRNAIVRFAQHHDKLPPQYRAQVARKIKQAAKRYGIKISPDNVLNKYASLDAYDLYQKLADRIYYTTGTARKAYEKIAELVPVVPENKIEKLAELVEKVDRYFGLDQAWEVLGNPYIKTAAGKKKRKQRSEDELVAFSLKRALQELMDDPDVELVI